MVKTFKKTIAVIICVLMVLTSLPFTAITAQASTSITLTQSAFGVVTNDANVKDETRYQSNAIQNTSEGNGSNGSKSFSFGWYKFTIPSLENPDTSIPTTPVIDDATLTFSITSISSTSLASVLEVYAIPDPDNSLLTDSTCSHSHSYQYDSSLIPAQDSSNSAYTKVKELLGLTNATPIGTLNRSTGTYTISCTSALQSAVDSGATTFTVVTLLSQPNSSSSWSDFCVGSLGVSANYSYKVNGEFSDKEKAILTFEPYTGTATHDSSNYGFTNDSNDYSKYYENYSDAYVNLVYSPTTTSSNQAAVSEMTKIYPYSSSKYQQCQLFVYNSSQVMLYDGVTNPICGVMFDCYSQVSGFGWSINSRVRACYIGTSSDNTSYNVDGLELVGLWKGRDGGSSLVLNHLWRYYSGSSEVTVSNTNDTSSNNDTGATSQAHKIYANLLEYKGGDFASGVYSKSITPVWSMNAIADAGSGATMSATSTIPIYVLNYKPVREAVLNAQTVVKNKSKYCATQYNAFVEAVYTLSQINPNSYSYSTNVANAVNSYASDVKSAMNAYNTAKTALVQHTSSTKQVTTKEATCTSTGTYDVVEYCTKCNETLSTVSTGNSIAQLEHTPGTWIDVEGSNTATCESVGTKQQTTNCTVCGTQLTQTVATTALGHTYPDTWTHVADTQTHQRICTADSSHIQTEACKFTSEVTTKPTCTSTGIKTYTCSVCGYSYEEIVLQTNEHSYTNEKYQAPDGDNNGYKYYLCANGCNEEDESLRVYDELDWSAYDAQLVVVENNISNTQKYTEASITAYSNAVKVYTDSVDKTDVTKSQAYIDNRTNSIIECEKVLELCQYTITTYVIVDGEVVKESEKLREYGDQLTYTVPDEILEDASVYKWSIANDDGTMKLNTTSVSCEYVVSQDAEYTVYLSSESTSSSDNDTAKVTLLDRSGRTSDIGYISCDEDSGISIDSQDDGTEISIGSASLYAVKPAFYDITGFSINNVEIETDDTINVNTDTITITKSNGEVSEIENTNGNVVIEPIYSAISGITVTLTDCEDTKGRTDTYASKWDERITVTADDADENTAWYINDELVGYGAEFTFRVTQTSVVTHKNEDTAKAVATVNYLSFNEYRNNTVTVVGSYNLPDGAELIDAGIILKTDRATTGYNTTNNYTGTTTLADAVMTVDNNSGVKKASKFTDTQQFTINVTRTANTSFIMGAVAFVKYKDATGEHVEYSAKKYIAYQA